jgi:hypothetical protein
VGNWEIEVHAGVSIAGQATDAKTTIPAPGESFTTRNVRPSRYISSWYFGDGAVFLNQWAAAFTNIPRINRITPLDPVLTGAAARSSNIGNIGFRVGRRLTPRFTAEVNLDYGPSSLDLSDGALGDIEASRATFASVWSEGLNPPFPFVNAAISSSSEIVEGSGGQIMATGALRVKLRSTGALVPYVTGGLGGVFNYGRAPSATLKGTYSMGFSGAQLEGQVPPGTVVTYNEADTVTVRFVRPEGALVGLVGGGFEYDLSTRRGFRVDLRLHLRPNAVDTEVSASPAVTTRTPAATFASGTTPSVQHSNVGSTERSTLTGPAILGFSADRHGAYGRLLLAILIEPVRERVLSSSIQSGSCVKDAVSLSEAREKLARGT